jgi:hypothetical protein
MLPALEEQIPVPEYSDAYIAMFTTKVVRIKVPVTCNPNREPLYHQHLGS